jgi:hypothetical protein
MPLGDIAKERLEWYRTLEDSMFRQKTNDLDLPESEILESLEILGE